MSSSGSFNPDLRTNTVALPGGVKVVFKGANIIQNKCLYANIFKCSGSAAFELADGSETTIDQPELELGFDAEEAYGIFTTDSVDISGNGKLTIDLSANEVYAICASGDSGDKAVNLNGGTLDSYRAVKGSTVTLGAITVPEKGMLNLTEATEVTKGATGATIDGTLILKNSFTLDNIKDLSLTGSGKVQTESGDDFVHYGMLGNTWVQDVTETGLDLSTAPAVATDYKAGEGYITWMPAADGAPATLTVNNASMSVQSYSDDGTSAVTLPSSEVNVTFHGENFIETINPEDAAAFSASVPVTFTMAEGSSTTLISQSNDAYGIKADGSVTIEGSGELILNTLVFYYSDPSRGYAICSDSDVYLNSGRVYEQRGEHDVAYANRGTGGIKAPTVTLGNITVPADELLNLSGAGSVTQATGTSVTNNGALKLKESTDTNTLNITGTGTVMAGDVELIKLNGEWVADGGDVTDTGLDLSDRPTVKTGYKAGTGYIVFTPATGSGTPTLTLNNATVAPTSGSSPTSGAALVLGTADIKLVLEGSSCLKGYNNMAMCAIGDATEVNFDDISDNITIGGSGSLQLEGAGKYGNFLAKDLTLTDAATVTARKGTVAGSVSVGETATLNAILIDYAAGQTPVYKVYGKQTIAVNREEDYSSYALNWAPGSGIEVNGVLTLAYGTVFTDIRSHLSGSGVVCIMKSEDEITGNASIYADYDAYLTDGTEIPAYRSTLNFSFPADDPNGHWDANAKLATHGYEFEGDSTTGYTLMLGNMFIKSSTGAIQLPYDGKVKVILTNGTCTRLNSQSVNDGALVCQNRNEPASVIITGSGRLVLLGSTNSLHMNHPLTISDGNIEAYSSGENGVGVEASDLTIKGGNTEVYSSGQNGVGVKASNLTINYGNIEAYGFGENGVGVKVPNLTINGGTLTACGKNTAFSTAPEFPLYTPIVSYGADEASATTEISPVNTVYTSNKYVKITEYTYTLTIDLGDGNGGTARGNYAEGDKITLDAGIKNGFRFAGWTSSDGGEFTNANSASTTFTMPDAATTVTANWAQIYALTVDLGDGNGGTVRGNYAEGDEITLDAGSREGFRFAGWMSSNGGTFDDASSASTTFTMPDAATTITANWRYNGGGSIYIPIYYTLTFNTNGGSSISTISRAQYTNVDLTGYQPTKTDFDFDGWYSDSSLTTKVTSVKLTKNTTVYAKWTAKTVTPEMPFVDVPEDAYYKDAVVWAVDENITEGTSATTFSPDAICTRAQAVTFLWRANGSPAPKTTEMPFNDVPTGSYYYDAVLWAVEQGIINGTSEITFSPDKHCSRAQIVTMLWRMEGFKTATVAITFADVSGDTYYADAVLWAMDEEITEGTSETTFSPDDNCTRAQIVTFIYRDMKQD